MCVANTYVVALWRLVYLVARCRYNRAGASVTSLSSAQQACLILRTGYVAKT